MSECYRNHCTNEALARITLIGGTVEGTLTFDLCLAHYYEAVTVITGVPATVGAIPHPEMPQQYEKGCE